MARGVVTFIWQRPSFVDFFFLLKRDVGFFREILLWVFESGKQVNFVLVNNCYQKALFLISKKLHRSCHFQCLFSFPLIIREFL